MHNLKKCHIVVSQPTWVSHIMPLISGTGIGPDSMTPPPLLEGVQILFVFVFYREGLGILDLNFQKNHSQLSRCTKNCNPPPPTCLDNCRILDNGLACGIESVPDFFCNERVFTQKIRMTTATNGGEPITRIETISLTEIASFTRANSH